MTARYAKGTTILQSGRQIRASSTRFSVDVGVGLFMLSVLDPVGTWVSAIPRSQTSTMRLSWLARSPELCLLMHALAFSSLIPILCGNYAEAGTLLKELDVSAEEKGASYWKAWGTISQGWLSALSGKAADAVQAITAGLAAYRSTGAKIYVPLYLSFLTRAHAELSQIEEAWRCVGDAMTAMESTKETWWQPEINRVAGEIALIPPQPDAMKAQSHFERALSVARQQQAKSWELRAAMSLARLWRDQGEPQQARELLAPVYGWFTEGLRHARSEGGEGPSRRIDVITLC